MYVKLPHLFYIYVPICAYNNKILFFLLWEPLILEQVFHMALPINSLWQNVLYACQYSFFYLL